MANEITFLRVYRELANQHAKEEDLRKLYWDLQDRVELDSIFCKSCNKNHQLKSWFEASTPDALGVSLAIDAVAHAIHQGGDDVLQQLYPGADHSLAKSVLDELAGVETTNEVRKYNRGYFTTLLAEDGIILLEKQMPPSYVSGRVTKEAIQPAIKEYEKLYKVGLASPAEILTLNRYYPENVLYRKAVEELHLEDPENEPTVVGGPASVEMVDREGHLITTEALEKAFTRFMKNFRERNLGILHSDVTVGWILPAYISKGGEIFASGTDDKQLWVIGELRNDTKVAKRVADEVEKGNLKSYSIAGSATETEHVQRGLQPVMVVKDMELQEITLCCVPGTKIWTKNGLANIEDIKPKELVYTHNNRWRSVVNTMTRYYAGEILKVSFDNGLSISVTPEHPIRRLSYYGQNKGTFYEWVAAEGLSVGDAVSSHFPTGKCDFCDAPLFKKLKPNSRNFCDESCRYAAPGNRLGKTITSGTFYSLKKSKVKKVRTPKVLNACECGCGSTIKNRYALGHNTYMKTEEQRAQWNAWMSQLAHKRRLPDFWDGGSKVIEVFGDYWHKGENPEDRAKYFKAFGYETLVIWEKDIKNNPSSVLDLVNEFNGNALAKIVSIEKLKYTNMVHNLEVEEDNSYSTASCVTHNCEQGINQGAIFNLLKSTGEKPRDLEVILNSFSDYPLVMPGFGVYVEKGDNPKVVIHADKSNSLTDSLILELQKRLPEGTPVVVYDADPSLGIPVYKLNLTPIWVTPQVEKEAEHSFPGKLGDNVIEKQGPPGPPPRPGLQWKQETSRWVRPEGNYAMGSVEHYQQRFPDLFHEVEQAQTPQELSTLKRKLVHEGKYPEGAIKTIADDKYQNRQWYDTGKQRSAKEAQQARILQIEGAGKRKQARPFGKLEKADNSYEKESEEINRSKKSEKANNPHKFIAAEWTHKNGHPRCKICGMEEGMNEMCPGLDKNNLTNEVNKMSHLENLVSWLQKQKEESWRDKEEEVRRKKHRQLLDEQGFPQEPDSEEESREDIPENTKYNPTDVNEAGGDVELTPEEKEKLRPERTTPRLE